jgi:hypothetical protein
MELSEMQNIWLENNHKLEQTLQINKVMLNQLLRAKPEKRMVRIKAEALFTLIGPFILLILIATGILKFDFNAKRDIFFYAGILIFGTTFLTNYLLSVKYYWLLLKVDLSEKILEIKTRILKAEAFKLKLTRISYMLMPFAITGIFMILGVPLFALNSNLTIQAYLPLLLITIVFIGSALVTFKYTLVRRFRRLKAEIAELELLMKENN